jgi:rsbT co-antagonist protein RsbR
MSKAASRLPGILQKNKGAILDHWLQEMSATTRRSDLIRDADLRDQSAELLQLIADSINKGDVSHFDSEEWAPLRSQVAAISAERAKMGFSPSETATYILSLKLPLFQQLKNEFPGDAQAQFEEIWQGTLLLDKIALFSTDSFISTREQIISRQQEEMLELSTPVVKLWDGILALPVIGTLDSARTQVVMEQLLQAIVDTNSKVAIIDITGVPTVDTLVAQHLLKTITAARLMGAECIVSGVRPQIAQTIVHLGIDLSNVTTKAKLADAFAVALERVGKTVGKGSRFLSGAALANWRCA